VAQAWGRFHDVQLLRDFRHAIRLGRLSAHQRTADFLGPVRTSQPRRPDLRARLARPAHAKPDR
jgi:hypothetical protein